MNWRQILSIHFYKWPYKRELANTARLESTAVIWIACVLLAIQAVSPFRFAYDYESSLVLSENRLRQLQASIDDAGRPGNSEVRIRLAAPSTVPAETGSTLTAAIPSLHSRAVTIRTAAPVDSTTLARSLADASFVQDTEATASMEKAARWNRLCIAVFEHQAKLLNRSDQMTVQTDRPQRSPIKLTSTITSGQTSGTESSAAEVAAVIHRKLTALHSDQSELDRKLAQRQNFAVGILSISRPWKIRVSPVATDRVRLLLTLVAAALAAVFAPSFHPPAKASVRSRRRSSLELLTRQLNSLRIEMLPMIGRVPPPIEPLAVQPPKRSGELVYRAAKGVIVVGISLAAARLLFDPLWRQLCLESPLAAASALLNLRIGRG